MAATVLQGPLTPLLGWETPDFTARVVVALLALGLLGTGLAYILYFRLIADLGAARASSVNYVVPVVAVVLGVLVLGEPVTWHLVVGGAPGAGLDGVCATPTEAGVGSACRGRGPAVSGPMKAGRPG